MKKYIIIILSVFGVKHAIGQQGFVVNGGDMSGSGGSVSYSVGQLDYQVYDNSVFLIVEGLQQPVESSVLPVSLLYFSARADVSSHVLLSWTTVSEINSDYFIVERSVDGLEFEPLHQVAARGSGSLQTDYAAKDENPISGYSFYRLKQVDKDGSFSYSPTQRVYIGKDRIEATVWPNPARDVVQVNLNETSDELYQYRLLDMHGKHISKGDLPHRVTTVSLANQMPGSYILQVLKAGKLVKTFKIIKVN